MKIAIITALLCAMIATAIALPADSGTDREEALKSLMELQQGRQTRLQGADRQVGRARGQKVSGRARVQEDGRKTGRARVAGASRGKVQQESCYCDWLCESQPNDCCSGCEAMTCNCDDVCTIFNDCCENCAATCFCDDLCGGINDCCYYCSLEDCYCDDACPIPPDDCCSFCPTDSGNDREEALKSLLELPQGQQTLLQGADREVKARGQKFGGRARAMGTGGRARVQHDGRKSGRARVAGASRGEVQQEDCYCDWVCDQNNSCCNGCEALTCFCDSLCSDNSNCCDTCTATCFCDGLCTDNNDCCYYCSPSDCYCDDDCPFFGDCCTFCPDGPPFAAKQSVGRQRAQVANGNQRN